MAIETIDEEACCERCGQLGRAKDRDRVSLADLPAFGSPVRLVWVKRRWSCRSALCPVGSWTEDRPDIAASRASITKRAPQGEVYEAWTVKESVRDLYTLWRKQDQAAGLLDRLIAYCASSTAREIRGLARNPQAVA